MATTIKRTTSLAATRAAGALTLTLAACGTSAGAAAATPSAAQAMSAGSTSQPFGTGCAQVPGSGAGSFSGMAQDPVATAASHNPLLSTLVTAVQKAGLVDTLNSAKNITVFAPSNAAFAKIPKSTLASVLANKTELTKILTYHVLPVELGPSALAGTHKTLEGSNLTVTGSGQTFTVNGTAKVVCGDVHTANATVYIINTVLMPKS
jgi:uncharacterized surface protein with fasciclin (FAS1) repeats